MRQSVTQPATSETDVIGGSIQRKNFFKKKKKKKQEQEEVVFLIL